MLENNKASLKSNDWVKGISRNGEMITGFVDSVSLEQETVYLVVAESDNEELIGKTIPMHFNQVEVIPLTETKNADELEFLIDLALATGDIEWFEELFC